MFPIREITGGVQFIPKKADEDLRLKPHIAYVDHPDRDVRADLWLVAPGARQYRGYPIRFGRVRGPGR